MAKQKNGDAPMKEIQSEKETGFTKGQILSSKKYSGSKDLLTVLLTENEKYTHREVIHFIEDFMKGEMK